MSKWSNIKGKIGTVSGVLLLLTALAFVESESAQRICSDVDVRVEGVAGAHFISQESIRQDLLDKGDALIGATLNNIDLKSLEEQLRNIPSVKEAEVYRTMNGVVHAELIQREPIVRVLDVRGNGFYIDREGFTMPLSDVYTPDVLVMQSAYVEPFANQGVRQVFESDSIASLSAADEAFIIAHAMQEESIWDQLFDHGRILKNGRVEMIPRVGDHMVVMGPAKDLAVQLKKLRAFYKTGIEQVGWRAYSKVDLRFDKQIVCTRK